MTLQWQVYHSSSSVGMQCGAGWGVPWCPGVTILYARLLTAPGSEDRGWLEAEARQCAATGLREAPPSPAQPSPARSSPILAPAPLLQHILPHEPGSSHTATPGAARSNISETISPQHNCNVKTYIITFCINIIAEYACCSPRQKYLIWLKIF